MRKTLKNPILIMGAVVVVVLIIAGYIAVTYLMSARSDPNSLRVQLYFLNPAANKLESETHTVQNGTNTEIVVQVFQLLYEGPKNKNLVKSLDESVPLIEVKIAEKAVDNYCILEAEFSDAYYEMDPSQELFFRTSLVWTMTGLPFIDNVHVYVDGEELLNSAGNPMGLMNRESVLLDPQISPVKSEIQVVNLYFADSQNQLLISEERAIQTNPDKPLALYIVEQLIAGSATAEDTRLIPVETKIREVRIEGTVCYVNLSGEFVSRHPGGASLEKLTVYSIVNSLTELSNVKKVQILVEGEKLPSYKGALDLSNLLERDESLIS